MMISSCKVVSSSSSSSSSASSVCSKPEKPRINQVGIQYLSEGLHQKIFPSTPTTDYLTPQHPALIEIAKGHLKENNLLNKKTLITDPINIDNFPPLIGNKSLDEHFYKIGLSDADPYLSMSHNFLKQDSELPPMPKNWLFESGWTRYEKGKKPESVPYPLEDELVFDVEVIYKKSNYSVLATCASSKAWYGWVSPFLTNYAKDQTYDNWNHLIPMNCLNEPKLIIGYNVSYDRARILEEYNIKQSKAFYLDAMALHVSISGICSQQRSKWLKHNKKMQEFKNDDFESSDAEDFTSKDSDAMIKDLEHEVYEDPWLNKGAPNSLANVYQFHCGEQMDKSAREYFSTEDPMEVIDNFNDLMTYCAGDVYYTFKLSKKLFPEFREKIPHPVSFSALRHLNNLILPTTKKWEKYVEHAEEIYQDNRSQVVKNLEDRAKELVQYIEQKDDSLIPEYEKDPWLNQLNWELKAFRLKKNGEPVANQAYLSGYPEWYRELFKNTDRKINLTMRSRVSPLLLRLKWEGYPLFWTDSQGWCFKVPYDEQKIKELKLKNYTIAKLELEDQEKYYSELRDNGNSYELFKIPHPDGPSRRCTIIMSKSYLRYFEDGTLSSEYNYASEILALNSTASYWMGNRKRIMDQFVVYNDSKQESNHFFSTPEQSSEHKDMGIILPKLCSMGTVTRRATENTWLTASNAKKNRIGSELKAMIEAPEGFCFVGADVDSEELWIASLVGDSMFKIHGGTALGWMTLEGDKNEKTDLHSKTSEILGISRGDAKVFNYGRIYGAGVKFATRLLKQFNPKLSDREAEKTARELYAKTKGQVSSSRFLKRKVYHGGSESVMFNALESIAYLQHPRTPVLGASITDALTAGNLNKNDYLTSRINWTIQSSGVDYLHLLIVSMAYLIERYNVNARLAITVHDELRYLVVEEDKYLAALLLQISNLWTRAMFCEQLGINEVPQSAAFFSEVDIDHVLRKEVHMDCITPSNPTAIPPGESLTILQLLELTRNGAVLKDQDDKNNNKNSNNGDGNPNIPRLSNFNYNFRQPFISEVDNELSVASKIAKLKLQSSVDKAEWKKNIGGFIRSLEENDESEVFELIKQQNESRQGVASSPTGYRRIKRRNVEEFDISSDGVNSIMGNKGYNDENSYKESSFKPKYVTYDKFRRSGKYKIDLDDKRPRQFSTILNDQPSSTSLQRTTTNPSKSSTTTSTAATTPTQSISPDDKNQFYASKWRRRSSRAENVF
ncbi:mitochondrial DNA polymerase catalytic subunit [Scheffersomyces coipomensis]|uniref:mitochondrial DNA polymerase catalytic subunit n=1 Tax=Scheffersomyces coipomensis TaxID=1788519 RepID=UPI00315CB548